MRLVIEKHRADYSGVLATPRIDRRVDSVADGIAQGCEYMSRHTGCFGLIQQGPVTLAISGTDAVLPEDWEVFSQGS